MVRLCGAALGLLAFAVTILLGLEAGNPAEVTIRRAVGALFLFCLIGLGTGWVAHRILDEHALRKNREVFPEREEAPRGTEPERKQAGETAAA